MSLSRLPGESNKLMRTRILNLGKFRENTTRQGLVNAISSALAYDQYNVLTRRIYVLTYTPYRTSTFTVTVNGVTHTQITEDQYISATAGYVVWKDENENWTRILEFIDPPAFTRRPTTRRHNGTTVEITYQHRDGDRVRTYTDKCNPYDAGDESFMGWYPESEGDVKVHALNDVDWIDDPSNGFKNADGTPTEKLKVVWREVDSAMPSTWGK